MAELANSIDVDSEDWQVQIIEDTINVKAGPAIVHVMAVRMYLASLEATIDFWVRFGFSDPVVDDLLQHDGHRNILHDFRNKTFHVTPVTDRAFAAIESAFDEIIPWAARVETEMTTYTRTNIHRLLLSGDESNPRR
jgi:hypothetical protein